MIKGKRGGGGKSLVDARLMIEGICKGGKPTSSCSGIFIKSFQEKDTTLLEDGSQNKSNQPLSEKRTEKKGKKL